MKYQSLFFVIVHIGLDSTVLSLPIAPPLTLENVMSVVKRARSWRALAKQLVRAYDKDGGDSYFGINLDDLQQQHHSDKECLKHIVGEFLKRESWQFYQQHYQHWPQTWRAVIWCLYLSDEIHLAVQIQSYAEPLEGVYVCVCSCILVHHGQCSDPRSMQLLADVK